jgi:hypothetical protein
LLGPGDVPEATDDTDAPEEPAPPVATLGPGA